MFLVNQNISVVIHDVIAITKMFDGDIFGGAIRDFRVCNICNIKDIDIRIDNVHFKAFMTLLHTKYNVFQLPNKKYNGITIQTFKISNKMYQVYFQPIDIDIVLMSKPMFRMCFIDFDVNLLTENEKSLYVRHIPHSMKYIPDKLKFIKDRIQSKTFSYLPCDRSVSDIHVIIEKAIRMTHQGWCMDDSFHNQPTWVVGRWDGFMTGKHRKNITPEKYKQIISCNECSLCHEKFSPNDMIFSTACNHCFHWKCNLTQGLSSWVREQHSSCPNCRSEMFSEMQST
jgi:hypothetical protein